MDLLKQDKALEKYRIEYKKNKLTLMDEINDIKGRFDYDSLKKYETDLRRFKKETTEAIQSGTLTSYQTYMARKWLLKTKIRNRDMLLWYLVYKYAYFNYLMKEIERNVFYEVNKHFVEETEKQCQELTGKDYKLDYIKLTDEAMDEPNNLGYIWDVYKDSTTDYNANEMYNAIVVEYKEEKKTIKEVLDRQENRIIKTKKKENGIYFYGSVENELDFITTFSQLQIFEKYGIERVKWVSVIDNSTCKECESMDGKEFMINDWNEYVKYENDDKDYETIKTNGIKIGENAPPIHLYCRCYLLPVK